MSLSFISEHSLEYVVVPRICEVLRANYKNIVPIYYWATREGNTLSRELHGNMKLRILSVFPRRPKMEGIDSDVVYGKINRSVLEFAEAAKSFGIPTIFGFPMIKSFLDISNDCKCLFLNVTKFKDGDIHFKVKKEANSIVVTSEQQTSITMLDNATILAIVSEGQVLNWDDALLHMNELRNINREHSWFWMSQYKPVYILMFQ